MDAQLRVKGLDRFRRDLRRADPKLAKALQVGNKRIAERVASDSQSRISSSPFPRSADAVRGVRPRARQQSASVALLGSNKFVRAFEFGTRFHPIPMRRGGSRRMEAVEMRRRVFPPWVGNKFDGGDWIDGLHGRSGHFAHRAIQEWIDSGGAIEELARMWDEAIGEAFPERTR